MHWALKRKFFYALGAIIFVLAVFSVPIYSYITRPPSCSDGKQNGDERGIDCGGACTLMCFADAKTPIIHWARVFEVSPGVYDAVSYIENPNVSAEVKNAVYSFKIYDQDNILISETIGKTYILPGETFAVFLSGIKAGERTPRYTLFDFPDPLTFEKREKENQRVVALSPILQNGATQARLTATLENKTSLPVSDIDVTAIVYVGENAAGASSTHVDTIAAYTKINIVFTWPHPLPQGVTKIEIIPRIR